MPESCAGHIEHGWVFNSVRSLLEKHAQGDRLRACELDSIRSDATILRKDAVAYDIVNTYMKSLDEAWDITFGACKLTVDATDFNQLHFEI